jgi:hypothetical protein
MSRVVHYAAGRFGAGGDVLDHARSGWPLNATTPTSTRLASPTGPPARRRRVRTAATRHDVTLDEQGARKNVYTRRITETELADLRGIEHTAHVFQRWVPKAREAGVIIIGDRFTTAAITSHSPAAHVDYRRDYPALSYELITPTRPGHPGAPNNTSTTTD